MSSAAAVIGALRVNLAVQYSFCDSKQNTEHMKMPLNAEFKLSQSLPLLVHVFGHKYGHSC